MSAFKAKASKGSGGDYERPPAGNHPAVLVGMFDMGTQKQEFQGEVKEQHRLFWVWELVSEKTKAGANHLIGMDLTFSLNEKAKMRAFIEARLARPLGDQEEYDVAAELGQPCLLNVVEKNGYPKVAGVSAVPKGMVVARPTYPATTWNLADFEATGRIDLPAWVPYLYGEPLSAHIARSLELADRAPAAAPPAANPPAASPATVLSTAANGSAPKPPSPPRPPAPPAAAPARYWVALEDGKDPVLLTKDEADAAILTKGTHPEKVLVCAEGSDKWRPAIEVGIKGIF